MKLTISKFEKKTNFVLHLFAFLVIWAIGTYILSFITKYSEFLVFQERDLDRAISILNGSQILYGPETTGGGHLPGPFYYWLLALFYKIDPTWKSCWIGLLSITSFSASVVWLILNKFYGKLCSFFWFTIFYSSPIIPISLLYFWNPSYTIFLSVIIILLIIHLFTIKQSFKLLTLTFLLSFLNIQIHYSTSIFILSILLLHIFAHKLNFKKIDNKHFFIAFTIGVLPVVPYFIFLNLNQIDSFKDGLSNGLNWLNFMALEQMRFSFQKSRFLHSLYEISLNILLVFPILGFVLVFVFKKARYLNKLNKQQQVTLILMLISFPIALAGLIHPNWFGKLRYTIPCGLSAIFFLTFTFSNFKNEFFFNKRKFIILFFMCFSAFKIAFFYNWMKQDFPNRNLAGPFISELEPALLHIAQSTGWTSEDIQKKIFSINIHFESGWKFITNEIVREDNSKKSFSKDNKAKGFLFYMRKESNSELNNQDFIKYLSNSYLEKSLFSKIIKKEIVFGKNLKFGRLNIIPLYETIENTLPLSIQNRGVGYGKTDFYKKVSLENLNNLSNIVKLSKLQVLVKNSSCESMSYECWSVFLLTANPSFSNFEKLNVTIYGESMSKGSYWISPDHSLSWHNPFVQFNCRNKSYKQYLADSIGPYKPRYPTFLLNHTYLAPFEIEIQNPCKYLTSIKVGVKSQIINSHLKQSIKSGFSELVTISDILN